MQELTENPEKESKEENTQLRPELLSKRKKKKQEYEQQMV